MNGYKGILLLTALTIFSQAHATGGFSCHEIDSVTQNMVVSGYELRAITSHSFGSAIVGNAVLSGHGSPVTDLTLSQYKNADGELYYLSVMDVPTPSIFLQRTVLLDTRASANEFYRGTLSVQVGKAAGVVPVLCGVN